ncbi:hypothetical protein HU200_008773 [Digitaria exilis]|uniref:Protein kinase domain-containing protein n=1 Tax=Digitaria exilis TaxID=1010633 RepID=A0A835KNI1_9POAL|nr:hypothetical protein HU200_008773 [Digitaria exilis]
MQEAQILLMLIIFFLMKEASATSSESALSKPGCPDKCGNVTIPYPFGIGDYCAASSRNPYFIVTCNNTFQPPRPTIGDNETSVELMDISLEHGAMRVYNDVSYTCFESSTTISASQPAGFNLNSTWFIPSTTQNLFTVIGCNTLGLIGGYMQNNSDNPDQYVAGCYSYCQGLDSTSDNASCAGLGCYINECELRKLDAKYKKLYPCEDGVCRNKPGGYTCICRMGKISDGTNSGCRPVLGEAEQVVIGLSICAVVVMSLTCIFVMKSQRSKHMKEKDEYFKQNGGLRLYDEMRSRQVDTILILSENEINRATDNFSEDHVLGCGGQGMVYKGTLYDGKEVAIKKSKVIDSNCREEFVNEIIILSQINHRNIVRLLGCCLEVDVPTLVYEFISNGTLFEFLHGNDIRSPAPLDLRLKIATQSAEALAYIHSSTSRTILHGDVKSLNILLDDDYNAKVSDFGASALKPMDKNDFIMLIQGTLGYIDPDSFVSHHLTDKSDVYSFGVVLLELMTRKKAIYIDSCKEKKALAHTFILMFHQNELRSMLDTEIVDDQVMVVLEKLAVLAIHCLSPKVDERPTMKEVAERLQILRRLQMQLVTKTHSIGANYFYGGPSVPVPSDEMGYQCMETDKLVLDVDLAR